MNPVGEGAKRTTGGEALDDTIDDMAASKDRP
jgi:hypothetical protein